MRHHWLSTACKGLLLLAAIPLGAVALFSTIGLLQAQQAANEEAVLARARGFNAQAENYLQNNPFVGVTTNGEVVPGLFAIESTGVSTEPVRAAAAAFLASLSEEQRQVTLFAVDDLEWRKWANQSIYDFHRQGVSFDEMDETQRQAAFALLAASLSAKGLELARDSMRLNETLAELNDNDFFEYGEGKYWITLMGEPSSTEPWGWQLDGHHLNINYFVLGDQVVMTPAFWGSEPVVAESGKYAGTRIMEEEQNRGLALARSLNAAQRAEAVLASEKSGNNILTQAFSDNVIVANAGINSGKLSEEQKAALVNLIRLYVHNMRDDHARLRMTEVMAHLDDTWFAWLGGMEDDSVFYYRIQSPVLLIEFDHQTPVGLTHLYPRGIPYKEHIHAVVRTPNGNDYGKDLLRQHYQRHQH